MGITEISEKRSIFYLWFRWVYFKVPKEIIKGWRNFLLFSLHYFSMGLLLKTFFSPWRGYLWKYPRGLTWQHVEVFLSNIISRVLGAIMRTFLIIGGVIAETSIFLLGGVIFLGWLLLPVLLIIGVLLAFILI